MVNHREHKGKNHKGHREIFSETNEVFRKERGLAFSVTSVKNSVTSVVKK